MYSHSLLYTSHKYLEVFDQHKTSAYTVCQAMNRPVPKQVVTRFNRYYHRSVTITKLLKREENPIKI